MDYNTIHTIYGLQRMAAAEAAGVPINLTHMAVGDGNGNAVIVSAEQTQLVRERFRAEVNRVFQDHDEPTMFTAEVIVPVSSAGFTMREVGIFDADGGLFAVGNLPATYKPHIDEGSYADATVRMEFMVSNTGVVTLKIDPNIVSATRTWVINTINPAYLLPGGTTGQIARKRSNLDGDIEWGDATDVNVVVETVEETQDLVDGQVAIDLVLTTTKGLAVYIAQNGYNGERLPKESGADGWQPDPDDNTRVLLGRAYPGARVICVQNEPLGSVDEPLAKDQNLADVRDPAAARRNLDVYNKAEADASGQPGDVKYTARSTAPTGWLKANGAAISRTAYAALFAVIGETYGKGDGFNTFNLPDLRGEFIRGWDDARGVDSGREIGTAQASQNLEHSHTGSTSANGSHSHTYIDTDTVTSSGSLQTGQGWSISDRESQGSTSTAGSHSHNLVINNSGGTEARPRNIALLACIKF